LFELTVEAVFFNMCVLTLVQVIPSCVWPGDSAMDFQFGPMIYSKRVFALNTNIWPLWLIYQVS